MSRGKTALRIPHDAYVFVGDGRKALLFRNEGDAASPKLRTEHVFENDNPPTREQGTDRPGRAFASVGTRRSAMEQTDWHELDEQRFARGIADTLQVLVREKNIEALVIAAPPKILACLRRSVHQEVEKRVIAEVDKDLTNQPVEEIEKTLTEA
ncbi:host attachment family protein [Bradyrhizobium sp. LHD-71]|uniref:host attachment family protein n=1 Tax=Bradyrhizobium sp. LHD-71 TaxID=3072141 RepID=UPI00280C94E7|nr:host attachment family protein [Bradyrhizobium sp. LHD-71]MDQ8728398.1 host attachment family protein [Bradyrhizobium sp. LHD-71]